MREDVAFIKSANERMSALVDDLLELARVGSTEIRLQELSMAELVEDVLGNLSTLIEESGARIKVDENLPDVLVDAPLVSLALQNLVQNAIKFRRSEVPLEIVVMGVENNEQVGLSVSDNGIGLPEEHQEDIFEPFKRLHTRDKYPGSGLGLAMVSKVAEKHHGSVAVKSELNSGSEFILTFPKLPDSLV